MWKREKVDMCVLLNDMVYIINKVTVFSIKLNITVKKLFPQYPIQWTVKLNLSRENENKNVVC